RRSADRTAVSAEAAPVRILSRASLAAARSASALCSALFDRDEAAPHTHGSDIENDAPYPAGVPLTGRNALSPAENMGTVASRSAAPAAARAAFSMCSALFTSGLCDAAIAAACSAVRDTVRG